VRDQVRSGRIGFRSVNESDNTLRSFLDNLDLFVLTNIKEDLRE
jgi:hypothetical protein